MSKRSPELLLDDMLECIGKIKSYLDRLRLSSYRLLGKPT